MLYALNSCGLPHCGSLYFCSVTYMNYLLTNFMFAWWQSDLGTSASLFKALLQTFGALLFVIVLAVVVLRLVLPRLNAVTGVGESMIRVVDRLPVSATQSLYVVEVAGRWLVVGISSAGVQLVSELDPASAEVAETALLASRAAKPQFGDFGQAAREKLTQLLKKEDKKK